ncbi:MAG: glycosyltransferase family 39 protein [Chloroflexota bacterium]
MLPTVTTLPRRLEWAALAIVLILAAVLRLGMPGVVEFKLDEANLSLLSLDMVHGRSFPLLGIDSSVGIRNAPVSVYIMALPYLFSSSPVLATSFVGLLNVIAVGFVYALARRYYGSIAAIVASLLYAVGPWAVIYSRKIWAQDMLPVFILLTIGCGLLGFVEGKRWAQLLCLPLLAVTGQIHYGAIVLIPAILYLIFVGRNRLSRWFLFSFVLTVLVILPYAIGARQASLLAPENLQKVLAPGNRTRAITFSESALQFSATTIAGNGLDFVTGSQAWQQFSASVDNITPLFDLLPWLVVAAGLWLVVRAIRSRNSRTPVDLTLLLWLVATPLVFSFTWTAVYQHYMIPLIPVAYLVIGIAVADVWRGLSSNVAARRLVFAIGGLALVAFVGVQCWVNFALLNFVSVTDTKEAFVTPLGDYIPIRDEILAEHPQNMLAKLDGQFIGFHDEATEWNVLLYDVPSIRYTDKMTDVYPAEKALLISHDCTATTRNFTLRPGDKCYALSTVGADDLDLTAYHPVNEAKLTFANGARITAYRWEPDSACLSVVWTINGPAPKEDFGFSVHLLNANKEKILQSDDLSWRGRYWRKGDTVVKHFCLKDGMERKGEIAGVRLGMYLHEDTAEGPKFYNQDLYDVNGAVTGQQIEIMFGAK